MCLPISAEKVRPEDINFMARYGRGLICLTLTQARCEQLRLPLMVSDTHREHRTNFTVSIEAAEGVTTGISAHDRAHTVRTAVARDARAQDLRQPGHIFPIMAQPGGVLTRAGHTEAGCDLARLAGLDPSAVIVEILNDDGSMARRDDLVKFARRHKLRIGTIADLIEYRLRTEQSVEIISESTVTTEFGEFRLVCLEDHVNRAVHLALVRGTIDAKTPTLVRVHRQDTLADVIGVLGGYLVAVYKLNFNLSAYLRQTVDYLQWMDVISGLVKAAVFGFLIALMGCYHGYNSKGGAQGVGTATTNAVVSASILLLSARSEDHV